MLRCGWFDVRGRKAVWSLISITRGKIAGKLALRMYKFQFSSSSKIDFCFQLKNSAAAVCYLWIFGPTTEKVFSSGKVFIFQSSERWSGGLRQKESSQNQIYTLLQQSWAASVWGKRKREKSFPYVGHVCFCASRVCVCVCLSYEKYRVNRNSSRTETWKPLSSFFRSGIAEKNNFNV